MRRRWPRSSLSLDPVNSVVRFSLVQFFFTGLLLIFIHRAGEEAASWHGGQGEGPGGGAGWAGWNHPDVRTGTHKALNTEELKREWSWKLINTKTDGVFFLFFFFSKLFPQLWQNDETRTVNSSYFVIKKPILLYVQIEKHLFSPQAKWPISHLFCTNVTYIFFMTVWPALKPRLLS